MLLRHGIAGLILIIVFQVVLIFKITPLADYYFPFIWFGYIFLVDSLVYRLTHSSLIHDHFKDFLTMLILSALFWWIFEWINYLEVNNWQYINPTITNVWVSLIFRTIAFSTVLPAIWVTYNLINALKVFNKFDTNKKFSIKQRLLYVMILIGIACFFLPFIFPTFASPLIWLSFFLIFDPINYMKNTPSITAHLANGQFNIPLCYLWVFFLDEEFLLYLELLVYWAISVI